MNTEDLLGSLNALYFVKAHQIYPFSPEKNKFVISLQFSGIIRQMIDWYQPIGVGSYTHRNPGSASGNKLVFCLPTFDVLFEAWIFN